jgi:hypothetical protein
MGDTCPPDSRDEYRVAGLRRERQHKEDERRGGSKTYHIRFAPPRCEDGSRTSVAMALARFSDKGSPSTF